MSIWTELASAILVPKFTCFAVRTSVIEYRAWSSVTIAPKLIVYKIGSKTLNLAH